MIETLRRKKLLTPRLLADVIPQRELYDKRAFYTFLSEVPADFMSFVTSPTKAIRVREHLERLYRRKPQAEEIAIVTRRLLNLATVATHRREEIEDRLRQAQYKNENWSKIARCQVCGFKFSDAGSATVDHILPLSLGGEDREDNWQLLCRLCNDQKGHHFGCCDLARSSTISNYNFFNLPLAEQLKMLSAPYLALRYEVFERAGRRCMQCDRKSARSTTSKLYLCILYFDYMISADNLDVRCEKCVIGKIKPQYRLK